METQCFAHVFTQIISIEDELDLPTLDGIQYLGDAKNKFILYNQGDIMLDRLPQPWPSPMDHNDNELGSHPSVDNPQ